jgi:hypothetical protein
MTLPHDPGLAASPGVWHMTEVERAGIALPCSSASRYARTRRMKTKNDADEVERALSMGEVVWALRCAATAIKSARKIESDAGGKKLLSALRRNAEIHLAHTDDEDRADSARAAVAWRKVTEHPDATGDDFEELAWAELLASTAKKAKAAGDEALARAPKRSREVMKAAIAWAARRKDAKRRDALVEAAASAKDVSRLEYAVRLLLQAHVCPVELADRLCEMTKEPVWDPRHARRVGSRVAAYRVADRREEADEILGAWVRACEKALPDPNDVRRHVLDHVGGGDPLERMQRRVRRVSETFGEEHPALEMPLYALASAAESPDVANQADARNIAVSARQRLDVLLKAKGNSASAVADRLYSLTSLRNDLIAVRRFDEAFEVIAISETLKARLPFHLVPDHYGRARVYEAQRDWDRVIEEHLAAVKQYEAADGPMYGPTGSNTAQARAWARFAHERAGRAEEGRRLFPPEKDGR